MDEVEHGFREGQKVWVEDGTASTTPGSTSATTRPPDGSVAGRAPDDVHPDATSAEPVRLRLTPRDRPRSQPQGVQEALVLLARPIADADVARAAQRRARADDHARVRRAPRPPRPRRHRRGRPRRSSRASPASGGRARGRPPRRRPARRSSARPACATSSWCRIASAPAACASALTENGWRTASSAARTLADVERVADPQPGEPVALGERAQDDEVRAAPPEVDARVGVVVELVLGVGLVEDHGDVVRDLPRRTPRSERAGCGSRSGCSGCRRSTIWVAAVISASIASRSCSSPSVSGTRISRAPDSGATYG